MGGTSNGSSLFYLDENTIKEHNGYVYYWLMTDYLEPSETGRMSNKMYFQGECGINRIKTLSYIFYNEPMGNGKGDQSKGEDEWDYPDPRGAWANMINYVCNYVD